MNQGIAGLILAGGRSQRMGGGDKTLLPLGSEPILAHVVRRITPQVQSLALNANGDPDRFAGFGLPVISDTLPGFAGPLAGVLTGMEWAAGHGAVALVTVAGDTPFFPADLVERLAEARGNDSGRIAIARSAGRPHPTFALWPVSLRDTLTAFLAAGETFRVMTFIERQGFVAADFDDALEPFFNVNTQADLASAGERLAGGNS